MEKTWRFIGWFLTKESKLALIRRFGKEIPDGWVIYCDHMTLAFNDGSEYAEKVKGYYESMEGQEKPLLVKRIGKSDRAIAVEVDYYDVCVNRICHVTLATAPDARPVESNNIEHWVTLREPMTINTVLKIAGKK